MSEKLADVQVRWQGAALKALLTETGEYGPVVGPWIPAWAVTARTRELCGCSSQAATGALRALLTVGLADRSETSRGLFWKPTGAAVRSQVLLLAEFKDEVEAIAAQVERIDEGVDSIRWMQQVRDKIAKASA